MVLKNFYTKNITRMQNTKIISLIILLLSGFTVNAQNKDTVSYAGKEGQFKWQFPDADKQKAWNNYSYSKERWWGTFPKDLDTQGNMFEKNQWAIGPVKKYSNNPVLSPTPGAWDEGRFSGGVHNGSVIVKDGIFYYVYRGERPIDVKLNSPIDYICDIGVATSKDGIHFIKDTAHSPFFRKGEDRKYSYEDVNLVKYKDTYYLFCNQWYWAEQNNYRINGTFLATSKDLQHWKKIGIVFPNATRTHRNAVVLQNAHNEAVRVNGKFVMYLNFGLIAYSDDMIHWTSKDMTESFPGGECCFALADYDTKNPDNIILFTGGNHTGHFYAIGEVLFSKKDIEKPLSYLPKPVLHADSTIYFEHGFLAQPPHKPVSSFADCIFFNGLTLYNNRWWFYYGGSEYYTCLANAEHKK
jgi:predicted GH43/DUF377 family glycosyl hydrolase